MRLFIAVNFDEQTKQNIMDVQNRLIELGQGNFSRPENLHLTLAFLGEVEPECEMKLHRLLDVLVVPPLRLVFNDTGRFRREGGDIWWIGIAPNDTLCALQTELCAKLSRCGFVLERRRFSPHITLAREVRLDFVPESKSLLEKPFYSDCNTVSLMWSHRINGKLVYTELHRTGEG